MFFSLFLFCYNVVSILILLVNYPRNQGLTWLYDEIEIPEQKLKESIINSMYINVYGLFHAVVYDMHSLWYRVKLHIWPYICKFSIKFYDFSTKMWKFWCENFDENKVWKYKFIKVCKSKSPCHSGLNRCFFIILFIFVRWHIFLKTKFDKC